MSAEQRFKRFRIRKDKLGAYVLEGNAGMGAWWTSLASHHNKNALESIERGYQDRETILRKLERI